MSGLDHARPGGLTESIGNLGGLLAQDPVAGGQALHRLFRGGRRDLHPQADSIYRARGALLPLAGSPKTASATQRAADMLVSSGGPPSDLYTAISLPFEERLAA